MLLVEKTSLFVSVSIMKIISSSETSCSVIVSKTSCSLIIVSKKTGISRVIIQDVGSEVVRGEVSLLRVVRNALITHNLEVLSTMK